MTPKRPYLLRAMYDWIMDNDTVPHIVVDTKVGNCDVPESGIREDGTIILNIGEKATWDFYIDDLYVGFGARFSGEPFTIKVPVSAVTAIYDKESGAGLLLGEATPLEEPEPEEPEIKGPPHLRLVVNNDES